MQRTFISLFFSTLPIATLGCLVPLTAKAQVTPDGTTATTVNQDGNNFTIEQGDRAGDNLFHSFDEFSVPTLGSAVFNNAGDINNIFSRVTGSSISNIDGLLGANGTANLYLINPNGIIFGENARLNLGGSFFASTADSLLFEGDKEFSAVNPQAPPLLEVSIPIGARFRDNPEDIVNRSFVQNDTGEFVGLEVLPGQNLTLLGGDVNFESGIATARGGSVYLGGLSEAGIVSIEQDNILNFSENANRANINFLNGAIIYVASEEGGSINLDARDINLFNGSQIIGGLIATENSIQNAEAGNININATNNVTLSGANATTNLNSAIQNNVESEATGNSGDVNIFARNLFVNNGAQIQTIVRRQSFREQGQEASNGNAGNININVSDAVTLSGISNVVLLGELETSVPSLISSSLESGAIGNAGAISITSDSLTLNDGGQIISNTAGVGDAGNLTFRIGKELSLDGSSQTIQLGIPVPATSSIFSNVETGGEGDGGIIDIQAQSLSVTNGAQIQTIVRRENSLAGLAAGKGNAGDINIDVEKVVTVSGIGKVLNSGETAISFASLISSSLDFEAMGKAGAISITSDSLSVSEGGFISSSTFGTGDAGNIGLNIQGNLNLNGINSTIDGRIAGGIYSTVEPGAEGNGGVIDIKAKNLSLSDGAQIQTLVREGFPQFQLSAGEREAGDIIINVEDSVVVSGTSEVFNVNGIDNSFPSLIDSALNLEATGEAGEISITSNSFSLNNGGQINVSSFGDGNGGDVSIQTNIATLNSGTISATNTPSQSTPDVALRIGGNVNFTIAEDIVLENNSRISAEASENANGGNVTINANDGFILAFPNQNNDIIANASEGRGGEINIDTQAIFGLEERPLNPITNDIDATSEANGLDGTVDINNPAVDPTTGLINLPASVGDASDQISQNPCQQGVGSQFIVTGKGGLPPNPAENLSSERTTVNLVEPLLREDWETEEQGEKETVRRKNSVTEAVPAMGWVFNDKGEVTLTAYSTSGNSVQRSGQKYQNTCQSRIVH